MKVLIIQNSLLPADGYSGPARVIEDLGKALVAKGLDLTYLVQKDSKCSFAKVLPLDSKKTLQSQIPVDTDIVHCHFHTEETFTTPVIFTTHNNNVDADRIYHPNTVFVSANHAYRHGGTIYVHNGIDFSRLPKPDFEIKRKYFHYLANAVWKVKNLKGAIDIAHTAGERLHVIGGNRINLKMGLRITLSPYIRFHGMLGEDGRNVLLNGSKGLIFPSLWHEPFGLNIIESLYFGCPLFGTPYGSLPELLGHAFKQKPPSSQPENGEVDALFTEYGVLSNKKSELIDAMKHADQFDAIACHNYALERFNAQKMAETYLQLYQQILAGKSLHPQPFKAQAIQTDKLLGYYK